LECFYFDGGVVEFHAFDGVKVNEEQNEDEAQTRRTTIELQAKHHFRFIYS
jgi:hypothetical protein